MPDEKIILKAKVARTGAGRHHLNRLRVPVAGVIEIRLENDKKKSNAHTTSGSLLPTPPKPTTPDDFCFAPGPSAADASKPLDPVRLTYVIKDGFAAIKTGKIELFRHNDPKPLWHRDLTKEELTDGPHTLRWGKKKNADNTVGEMLWDGRLEENGVVAAPADAAEFPAGFFPDHYLTVEHTPYKLKITVGGAAILDPAVAWTYFSVLVHDIELELGPKEALTENRDRGLWDEIMASPAEWNKKLPTVGATSKLYLKSDLFSTNPAQMHDNSHYDRYRDAWSATGAGINKGPNIPVFAKIRVRNAEGKPVEAPLALGRVKFLWEWECVDGAAIAQEPQAVPFINPALNYSVSATKPKGKNCHIDRGGKRGNEKVAAFPKHAGYAPAAPDKTPPDPLKDKDFPFKVTPYESSLHPTKADIQKRKWAAYSYPWTKGIVAGKTGVLFQPSHLAGDAYKVTVTLAYEKTDKQAIKLDTDVEPLPKQPEAIQKSTGTIQIWRRIHIASYKKKKLAITGFTVPQFEAYYQKAYIQVVNSAGAITAMQEADYNARLVAPVTLVSGGYQDYLFDKTLAGGSLSVNHYTAGDFAVKARTYIEWQDYMIATFPGQFALSADPNPATRLAQNRASVRTFFAPNLDTEAKYAVACDAAASGFISAAFDYVNPAQDGVNVLQFEYACNMTTLGSSYIQGFAGQFPSTGPTKCCFVQLAPNNSYAGFDTMVGTVAHEIGHCLFLPHSADDPGNLMSADIANQPSPEVHDEGYHNCVMSYDRTAKLVFCGFCLLRLRGWSRFKLDADGAQVAPQTPALFKTRASNQKI